MTRATAGRVPMAVGFLAILGTLVVLWGGYHDHWRWTGFGARNTLWDWLQLLLLPAAVATLPIWVWEREQVSARRRRLHVWLLAGFVALVVAGYLAPMEWTGFPGNTLWDWLELAVLPAAIVVLGRWPSWVRRIGRRERALAAGGLAVFVALVVAGYVLGWGWTGFRGNTLWDWLRLLLVPALLPVVEPVLTAWLKQDRRG